MNREIVFRGKAKKSEKGNLHYEKGEWVYGGIGINVSGSHIVKPVMLNGVIPTFQFIEVDLETIGQFTGLKDKNGKEIYEGDVGEIKTQSGRIELFVVEWGVHRREMASGWTVDIPGFAFMIDGKATFPICNNYLNGHDLDIIEIIGNIYENPELLTPHP